jgi:hypothetical protein
MTARLTKNLLFKTKIFSSEDILTRASDKYISSRSWPYWRSAVTLSPGQLENTWLTSLKVSDIPLTSLKVSCDPKCSTAREHLIDLSECQWHPFDLTEGQLSLRWPQVQYSWRILGGDPMKFKNILLTALKVRCDPKCSAAGGRLIDLPEGQGHPLDFTEDQLWP